jgi:hypothetical protein
MIQRMYGPQDEIETIENALDNVMKGIVARTLCGLLIWIAVNPWWGKK